MCIASSTAWMSLELTLWERSQAKKVHIAWSHLYKISRKCKPIYSSVVAWGRGVEGKLEGRESKE